MAKKGDSVVLRESVAPWYSGYGMNPSVILPAGSVGTIQSVDVPRVRGRGKGYSVARFMLDGQEWQVSDIEARWEAA